MKLLQHTVSKPCPRGKVKPGWQRVGAGIAVIALLGLAPVLQAVERLQVTVAAISAGGLRLTDVRLDIAPDTGVGTVPARVEIGALTPPGRLPELTDLHLRCPALRFHADTISCAGGTLDFRAAGRVWRATVDGRFDRGIGTWQLSLTGLRYSGGTVDLDLHGAASDWRLRVDARSIAAGKALARLAGLAEWQFDGEIDLSLRLDAPTGTPDRLQARLTWQDLAFSGPDGLHAGEHLRGTLDVNTGLTGDRDFALELTVDGGQIYLDPVFIDLARHPATLTATGSASPDWQRFEFARLELEQPGVGLARGSADLSRSAPGRFDADIEAELQLPGAYAVYAQPFLIGTAVGDLATDGTAHAKLALGAGTLNTLRLTLDAVEAIDRGGRFGLHGVTGTLNWSAQDNAEPEFSTMRWSGGRVHGLALGATTARFLIRGDDFRLTAPLHLPVLDGALEVRELALTDVAGGNPTGRMDAALRPVSLAGVADALGWPALTGSVSGRLPRLEYSDGVATLGGELRIDAAGGTLRLEDLRLSDPFGPLPELTTSVTLRGLSLEAVTQAFSFGRITGTLDGDIDNLRLVGWQPAAFDAWFRTPEDDPRPHRISQRAVRNLASLGGGGGAVAALSRGFLQFFRSFNYDRIGLGCRLRGTVCRMRGLEPAEGGYLIVRGRGLPHIDIVGFNREVSWPTLVQQLIAATRGEGPVVK